MELFSIIAALSLETVSLPDSAKLFPDHSSECFLEWFRLVLHMVTQRLVDQALVVTPASLVDLLLEVAHDVAIESNRDPHLVLRSWQDGAAPALTKVVVVFHAFT
jgi:hypothetical protein